MRHLMRVLLAARSAVYGNFSFTFPVVAAVGSLFLGATRYAFADIINVPGDQPTIQAGIDAALNGDEVVIANGTYTGAGNVNLNFNGKLITVRSASGDPTLCIINGQNVNGGFTFNNGETNAAVVDGLTIITCQFAPPSVGAAFLIQSSSPTINNCILSNNFTGMDGGAIYCDDASPTITNCTFIGNFAIGSGGAIYNNNASTPDISDCSFQDNTALGDGGTIYNNTSSPGINNCTFTNNNADDGGAIYNHDSTYAISNCTFTNNDADNGGAIYNITSNGMNCDAIIANCTFTGNSADFDGGGIFNAALCPTVTNCTFNENTAQTRGGAIFVQTGLATITGCVFTSNTALTDVGGGVAIIAPNDHTIEGCLFESNSAALAGGGIDYSPVEAKGANSLTVCNTNFAGNFTLPELMGVGGAISNTQGTLELESCTLDTNTATTNGGGIYTAGGIVSLTFCVLGGNSAGFHGGGIANEVDDNDQGGALTLTDCQLIANQSVGGGGINSNLGSVSVTNCTFSGNSANGNGGGAMRSANSTQMVTNCTFSGNHAGSIINGGGAMSSTNSTQMVTNCTFSGNTATVSGGAMNILGNGSTVTNCTFSGNMSVISDGGAIIIISGTSTVTNCNLWGNSPDEISFIAGTAIVTHSNVQGGFTGTGNIDADPLFVDPDGPDNMVGTEDDNLRLSPGSPCIDAADNDAPELVGITEDLDGNPRFVDDPDTTDTGNGDPPIVDMGAYEFQPVLCPADFDNSGDVGVNDLLFLLGAWGLCPPKGDCLADFDNTGDVGVNDLLFLLGAWGPCP